MGTTITNIYIYIRYGVKRDYNEKLIGIKEFLEQLSLDCFNYPFSTDTGTPEKNIPPLGEVDDGETVFTCRVIIFSSSASSSIEVRTISDITINSASYPASTFVISTIGYQHTNEKEGSREGGRYNMTTRG